MAEPIRSISSPFSQRPVGSLPKATAATRIPPSLQAKMAAMANRSATSSSLQSTTNALQNTHISSPSPPSPHLIRSHHSAPIPPTSPVQNSAPNPPRRLKPAFKLADITGSPMNQTAGGGASGAGLGAGRPFAADDDDDGQRRFPKRAALGPDVMSTPFSNFDKIVDPSGALNFGGKAVLHASGVDFSNGSSFAINMSQMQLEEELGRGNYGTVKKVLHKPTNVLMAMKEIRLELDSSKLNAILMELDILHRAVAPEIVEFYGAFFIESCVYYCMEFMDAGSLDKLQSAGIPEDVLARITGSMVRGLKFLKDELQIMHRDVKPTNVLVNKKGEIKLCDFGVSGQLEKSLAKTNIGCQSYMAPERIKGESTNSLGTYTVSSDVWSLGLSMIEIAIGHYPYPPETYQNVFAQLTAIVHGPPPKLPESYTIVAHSFVERCLVKEPEGRATYNELLEHPFLIQDRMRTVDMVGWVLDALAYREAQTRAAASGFKSSSESSSHSSLDKVHKRDESVFMDHDGNDNLNAVNGMERST